MMKCIAIDDEPIALSIISQFVKRLGNIDLHTYSDPIVGFEEIKRSKPDFVFLDIEMGETKGTDLAKELPPGTLLVFTTAYAEYALNGFDLNAIDFLHKPFSFGRFEKTIEKVEEFKKLKSLVKKPVFDNEQINIKVEYKNVAIKLGDIIYIEAMDNYIKINLAGSRHMLSQMSMKSILAILPSDKFIRIHKSFIVPIHRISNYSRCQIILYDRNITLPIGRTYVDAFYETMINQK